jgi:HK97 gp10 family phage protein
VSGTFRVAGSDALRRKLGQLGPAGERAARRSVKAETEETVDDMRRAAPEDTGALKRGMQAEFTSDGLGGRANSTAAHNHAVEFGTDNMPARPHVGPAAAIARRRFRDRLIAELNVEIRKLGR